MVAGGTHRALTWERWYQPAMAGLALGILALAVLEWAYGWFGPPSWRRATGDLAIYTDATRRLLSGGSWYLERQLHGPYEITGGDVLYPPAAAWAFSPWLVLPGWSFVVVPAAIIGWVVVRHRPAPWTWPLMALCLLWPMSGLKVLSANPNTWVAAAVGLGTIYGWTAAFVLLKPSLLPFALFGVRSRAWWGVALALIVASLPLLAATLAYPRVLLDSRGPGLAYSLWDVPLVLIPVIAWLGRVPERDGRRAATGRSALAGRCR